MMTSCPARAAAMPPLVPRQDITTAFSREAAFEDLVPPDQPALMRGQERVHLPDEPALQLVLVGEAELANPRLDAALDLPFRLVRFVTADVDVPARKDVQHLAEHVLHELNGRVGSALRMSEKTPHRVATSIGSPVTPSSGYDAIAATA